MILDPDKDLETNTEDLHTEFRSFAPVLYRYYKQKAKVEQERDIAKAKLKEMKAQVYKRIKSDPTVKHTEKSLEAEIDTDAIVLKLQDSYFQAEHDASTWQGAVDSMKAKKDCLIQLGADSRKERS